MMLHILKMWMLLFLVVILGSVDAYAGGPENPGRTGGGFENGARGRDRSFESGGLHEGRWHGRSNMNGYERGRSAARDSFFRSRWNEEGFSDDSLSNLDHQRALDGVKSGRYRSLKEVISIVGIPESSRIVRMGLLNQGGIDVYSLIVRDASGHLERMTVDAATGERVN